MGFMNEFKPHALSGDCPYFLVTKQGMQAVREFSPPEPVEKLTRSQKRYRSYLKEDCGEGFGEWLKSQKFRKPY